MEQLQYSFGKHYLVEFIGCAPGSLTTVEQVRELFLEAARLSGANILDAFFHQFQPHGVTGIICIAESHFSIHTWPEAGYAAFDILTCGKMLPELAIEFLRNELRAQRVEVRVLTRGYND